LKRGDFLKKFRIQKLRDAIYSVSFIVLIFLIWHLVTKNNIVPKFMLPSPMDVLNAFISDFPILLNHFKVTIIEAFIGLAMGILLGFTIAVLMDRYEFMYKALYPVLIITQTIPTVSIAPLLVLWLGYGIAPKVVLIVIVTFFPIAIGLLDGFKSIDRDQIRLMEAMNATKRQIFIHGKLPHALPNFFSSLRISASYAIVGAVISEWLGGFSGLGVYMTRVKKSYSFDKMFAVIFLITITSLILMGLVKLLEKISMPWKKYEKK